MKTKNEWIAHGVYGTYKTAESVSSLLRKFGWHTKITKDAHQNCTVWKKKILTAH